MTKPDQRGADRGRHARRPWRQRFDTWLPLIIAVFLVVLAVMSVVSVAAFSGNNNAKKSLHRQALTARNGCERVQLVRDDVNVTSWGVYNALSLADQSLSPVQVQRLLVRTDPATQALITALLAAGENGRDVYMKIKDAQRYLPPTDCEVASRNPRYRFPQPISFAAVADCYDPITNPRPEKPCPLQ